MRSTGTVATSPLAVTASPLFPMGFVRRVEPTPGVDVDAALLAAVAAATRACLKVWVGVAAGFGQRRPAAPHPAMLVEAGATRVIGIEGRQSLVQSAKRTLAAKGVPESRYRMIVGDVHSRILGPDVVGDVVMCLGFLYHTARYVELMAGIRSTGAEYVIVDTRVLRNAKRPVVELRTESTFGQALAIRDRFALDGRVISAVPSEAAVVLMLEAAGYDVDHRTDWSGLLAQHPGAGAVRQYADGRRVTFRAKKRSTR